MKKVTKTPAELAIEKAREKHINTINALIDAIICVEDYYERLPADLRKALKIANDLRSIAEEEIKAGDLVYDCYHKKPVVVLSVQTLNLTVAEGEIRTIVDSTPLKMDIRSVIDYKVNTDYSIGKKFCFKKP